MITIKQLREDTSYRYYGNRSLFLNSADMLFQKTIWDKDHKYKLYFINVWVYDFRAFPEAKADYKFDAEITLYQNDRICLRVMVAMDQYLTLREFEDNIKWIFDRLNCQADMHNN